MHPTQPIPGGSESNPYDFILNEPPKKKRSFVPKGESKKQRIIIMAGLAMGLLTLIIIVFSLFSNSGKGALTQIEEATKEQQEIIRVAELGERGARSGATQSFAISVKLALVSSQQQFLTYLEGRDRKLKGKDLDEKLNEKTDTALKAGADSGQFDTTFTAIMTEHLTSHKTTLANAYDAANSNTQKQLLQDAYKQVEGLLNENKTDFAQ